VLRSHEPWRRQLLLITGLAVVVRLAFLWLEPSNHVAGDEHTWLGWALAPREGLLSPSVHLSAFRSEMLFYPPLYPYFIALTFKAGGSLILVKAAQAVLGALLVPALGRLGRQLFGASAGLAAALVAALYPELVWYSVHFWSETIFLTLTFWGFERIVASGAPEGSRATSDRGRRLRVVLLLASVPAAAWVVWGHDLEWGAGLAYVLLSACATGAGWHLLRANKSGRDMAAVAGLVWGLAILTRETLLYFVPVAMVFMAWRNGEGRRRAALMAMGAVLVVAPWTYRNYVVTHTFIPVGTSGALNLWQGNTRLSRQEVYARTAQIHGPGDQRVAQYRFHRAAAWDAILSRQPTWFFDKLVSEMPAFWEADSLVLIHMLEKRAYGNPSPGLARTVAVVVLAPYLLLLVVCAIGAPRLRWTLGGALLLSFIAYYNLIHVATHGFSRYRLPVLPVLFLIAGALAVSVRGGLLPWTARRRVVAGALLLGAVAVLAPSVHQLCTQPLLDRGQRRAATADDGHAVLAAARSPRSIA